MFIPIKSLCDNIFSNDEKIISNEISQTISYCKMLIAEVKKTKSDKDIKKLIIEHMYIIYYCFKMIGVLKLTSGLSNIFVNQIDANIENYIDSFFSEQNNLILFQNIRKNARENKNKDELYFCENMIDKFNKNYKNKELEMEIKKITNNISEILEKEEKIKIPLKLKKYFGNQEYCLLNREKYYTIQKKILNPNTRKEIESLYFAKSDRCFGLLEKLAILRYEYANKLDFATFHDYSKRRETYNSEEIKSLIGDLILKIDFRSKKEVKRITKKLSNDKYKKKVDFCDFIYYHEEMGSKCFFTFKDVTYILFKYINKYFSLELKEVENKEKLWNKKIKKYEITFENKKLGYIYFDIEHNMNKKISSPICIHMCHDYIDIDGNKYDKKVAVICNFNTKIKNISHSDVISLFKEFGNAIQFLSYDTKTGNMIYRDDFYLLTSKIMEYICWEKDFLIELCKGNEELVEHILFTRFINFANSIKLRCVNAYFDHIIHNSKDLIVDLKKIGTYGGDVFKTLYKQIFKNVFASQKDILNMEIDKIHPIVVLQEINGTETSVYENIVIEILSYSVFSLIKANKGKKYIEILSKAGSDKFKEQIKKFISKIEDNYNLYLQELIGYNEIDTELNMKIKNENSTYNSTDNDVNYFDDGDEDEDRNSDNKENTIFIDRKLELN